MEAFIYFFWTGEFYLCSTQPFQEQPKTEQPSKKKARKKEEEKEEERSLSKWAQVQVHWIEARQLKFEKSFYDISTILQSQWTCVHCNLRSLFLAERNGTWCGFLL